MREWARTKDNRSGAAATLGHQAEVQRAEIRKLRERVRDLEYERDLLQRSLERFQSEYRRARAGA